MGSERSAGVDDHGFEALVAKNRLIRTSLVDPFSFREPSPFAEFKEGRGVARTRVREIFECIGIEMDADQGEETSGLAIPSPEHFVMPVGIFPTVALVGIELGECAQKTRFEPFALEPKEFTCVIDMHFFGELPSGSSNDEPGGDETGR